MGNKCKYSILFFFFVFRKTENATYALFHSTDVWVAKLDGVMHNVKRPSVKETTTLMTQL